MILAKRPQAIIVFVFPNCRRQRVSNILQNSFGIDFFAYLKIGEDDVEEAQLVNLLGKNLLPVLPALFGRRPSAVN